MEKTELRVTENCFICGEFMGPFRNEFSVCTGFSEKPIYEMFESFTKQKLSDDILYNSGICQNCFIKFNEYDEHFTMATRIQNELLLLFDSCWSENCNIDIKSDIKIEEDDASKFRLAEVMLENNDDDEISSEGTDVLNQNNKRSRKPFQPFLPKSSEKGDKRTYKRKKNLDEGLTVVEIDGQKIYQCDVCRKLFKDRYKLKTHREIHTTERTVCCTECGAMFKTLTCLYSHKKIHRERVYHQCDLCEMRYIQKTQLRKHMDAIHLMKKDHVCSICGKCYSRDTTLSKHMFVHKEHKDIVCTVCGFRCHTKPKMERHMKSHTGERNYSCKICGKRFLYSYNVTAHIKHVHNREKRKVDEEKLRCKFCGKRFQKIWKVKEHMANVHHLVDPPPGEPADVLLIKEQID
ncbi:CLUMA_CG020733, isoform A [Clunio marinus]|uniref:CLUMA_CG020733, isoform A n=1 Tax=Clunio marinus TaxID=568069 RepID=A0A1J1J5U8_9DIPT|nr:CLUMA_CG020733, isoform A [Clunio marinus]